MGEALIAAAARGRHPAHPARHLLPRRRADRRRPPAARRGAERFSRRHCRALGGRVEPLQRHATGPHRCGGALGARRAGRGRSAEVGEAAGGAPAARAPQRAAGREPRDPGVLRRTPTELLAEHGLLGRAHHRRARHPPHRRGHRAPGRQPAPTACFCPTTERDLADGIGPARRWPTPAARSPSAPTSTPSSTRSRRSAGSRCTSGSTSHERGRFTRDRADRDGQRGRLPQPRLADGGRIADGALADFVAVRTDSRAHRRRRGPARSSSARPRADVDRRRRRRRR